jgi:hypothetical protein
LKVYNRGIEVHNNGKSDEEIGVVLVGYSTLGRKQDLKENEAFAVIFHTTFI